MASSVSLGYPLYDDGMSWSSLLSRQFEGGAAVWDANASATAVNPMSGVFPGPGSPLGVTQAASPAMSVLVNAGYCAVAHLTQGHGAYIFGQLSQGTLTVAANSSGQTRIDLVLARVYDLGNSSSYCDIEIVEGTPGAGQAATPGTSLLLATVTVASGATSITNGSITDKRAYTAAPGGILPAATGAAPPAVAGQVVYDTSTGALQRATSPDTYTMTWTEPGTYSWFVPADCLPPRLQAWASGSAGGGYDGTDNVSASGGPAGEYAEEPGWEGLTEGQELVITVPAGGNPSGTSEANQTAGADATITLGADVIVHAHAGGIGVNTSGQTVPGGTGSTNTIHNDGGAGGAGESTGAGGGGGGSGGPGAPGQPGGTGDYPRGGRGASAVPDGGPGGQGGGDFGNGQAPAYGPGGGGGGGSGMDNGGGGGADGQAAITWTIQPSSLTALASADSEISDVDTSTGTPGSSGLYAGDTASSYGWGIGFGSASGGDYDGNIETVIQVQFDADGQTDFQLDAKWGMTVPEAALHSGTSSVTRGQCQLIIAIDYNILDTICLRCATSGGVAYPADAGSWTYYTSSARGTTPASGTHTAMFALQTFNTHAGNYSGAHVGNLASTGTSAAAFGSVPSYFTSALTAENCYLRVAGILASAI
jgi:hypothetical protein